MENKPVPIEARTLAEYRVGIRDLPAAERPRERLRELGADHLSSAELLAIILRTGTPGDNVLALANKLLAVFKGLPGLAQAGFVEICGIHGLGEAKAAQVKAALELGKRLASAQPEARASVHSPEDVFHLLSADMALLEQERLRVLLLNTKNQVLSAPELYRGSVNTSQIRVGELFREAIRQGSCAIIVVHNHPSGDPTPSHEDVEVTRQMVGAGKLLDIEVLDHIVIGQGQPGYVSLKERGLGFGS